MLFINQLVCQNRRIKCPLSYLYVVRLCFGLCFRLKLKCYISKRTSLFTPSERLQELKVLWYRAVVFVSILVKKKFQKSFLDTTASVAWNFSVLKTILLNSEFNFLAIIFNFSNTKDIVNFALNVLHCFLR